MEIVLLVAVAALLLFIFSKFKIPRFGCISLITGGVKTGKSMLSVYLAYRKYKSQRRKWKFKCFLCRLLKKPLPEEPLFYSNVHLAGIEYTLLTKDALERKVRLAYGSVTYIQEASLLADSMMFKDMELSERLTFFNKLYGHETRGGYLIYDTQTLADNHYAVKRALSTYFWIHHTIKIPFFCLLYVREMVVSEGNDGVQNDFTSDVEDTLKVVIVPKSVWKMYDAYCYSALTDDLPLLRKKRYNKKKRFNKKLKIKHILSFRKFITVDNEEKDNVKK